MFALGDPGGSERERSLHFSQKRKGRQKLRTSGLLSSSPLEILGWQKTGAIYANGRLACSGTRNRPSPALLGSLEANDLIHRSMLVLLHTGLLPIARIPKRGEDSLRPPI